ncbi:unnamed protein product [Lampetra fluviatilis]
MGQEVSEKKGEVAKEDEEVMEEEEEVNEVEDSAGENAQRPDERKRRAGEALTQGSSSFFGETIDLVTREARWIRTANVCCCNEKRRTRHRWDHATVLMSSSSS